MAKPSFAIFISLVIGAVAVLFSAACQLEPPVKATAGPDEAYVSIIGTGTVRGRVLEKQGSFIGVPGVLVYVPGTPAPVSTETDANGYFVLEKVPQGKQYLVVSKPGYAYNTKSVWPIADVMPQSIVDMPEIELVAVPIAEASPTDDCGPAPAASSSVSVTPVSPKLGQPFTVKMQASQSPGATEIWPPDGEYKLEIEKVEVVYNGLCAPRFMPVPPNIRDEIGTLTVKNGYGEATFVLQADYGKVKPEPGKGIFVFAHGASGGEGAFFVVAPR